MKEKLPSRIFKTAWFAKAAKRAHIGDADLCSAIREVMLGQADDLGGGVFKKRLHQNMHRSIILAKGGRNWVYVYVFSKQVQSNISDVELVAFKMLADAYARKTPQQVDTELSNGNLKEICHDK